MAIVYEHLRNDTNEVFYVGIGKEKKRAYNDFNRSTHWQNIVNEVGHTVKIIHNDVSWEEACEIEKSLIKNYGRKDLGTGNLINKTNGGKGNYGTIVSIKTRQKMSKARKGEKNPMFGKLVSDETRLKISEANKGENHHMFGKKHSDEFKQKISESLKGEKNHMFGKNRSDETRQKMSKAKRNQKDVKGYYFHKGSKKYISQILVGLKRNYLGSFDTPGEAADAYQKAKLIYHV